jgi:hypothetical protein
MLALNVPYKLCGGCWDYYNSIDNDHESAAFAEDLWRLAARQSVELIRAMKPQGTA